MDDFTLTIDVTAEHIARGDDEHSFHNPAERALADALEAHGLRGFEVETDFRTGVRVTANDTFATLLDVSGDDLEAIGDWVYDWACVRPVEPASFVLDFSDHDPTP